MRRRRLGLSAWAILGLAALGVPRVVAHDLRLAGPAVNALLVFVPIAVWAAVVLWRRVPNPFLTLLAVGAVHGVLLGVTHQLLWDASFGGEPPRLGGTLAGALSPAAEGLLLRGFALLSSLATGLGTGAAVGAAAWVISRIVPGFRPHPRD
ncbi:hypothetical protein HII36_14620 [Nonomuraea sp. NN258]|uniref:hypothetical protein n=1 Tax=Nonomuraea antri TaxID=2730852 RepID=UPI001568BD4E|nr:hypothetical protein [Nonomuraea antri]NRQ33065.1 hypothetical protein [Nonomuraea antri]